MPFQGGLLGGFARQLALRDGRISCAEVFFLFSTFFKFFPPKYLFFSLHLISGLLPWSPGLLHRDGQSSRDCHPHLGGNFFIGGCGNFFWGGGKFEHLKPDLCPICVEYCLQGSVVVFGSWPNWTSEDLTSADYCMETPMLFAFVLQIVRWVRKIGKTSTG